MIPKVKYFAWKLIGGKFFTRDNLREIGIDINGDCSFCQTHLEDIDHLLKRCSFVQQECDKIINHCPLPIICDLSLIDWIDSTWKYNKVYNRL